MEFSRSIDIQASPSTVWSVLKDVERWPEWTPTVLSVRRLDSGPLAVGSRARLHQPRLRPAEWQVTEVNENRNFTWVMVGPGMRVTGDHRIDPQGTGSRVTLSLKFAGPLGALVCRLTRGLNERYLRLEIEGLKARSEAAS